MTLKYISEEPAAGNHAGNKARRDVDAIFARRGYKALENIVETRFGSTLEKIKYTLDRETWKKVLRLRRFEDQTVIAQFPVYGNKIMRAALNDLFDRNRMIFIVHDLDALRNFGGASSKGEIERLNRAALLIVHNERMMGALFGLGVRTSMISLELFDYLLDNPPPARNVIDRNKIISIRAPSSARSARSRRSSISTVPSTTQKFSAPTSTTSAVSRPTRFLTGSTAASGSFGTATRAILAPAPSANISSSTILISCRSTLRRACRS